ncbi:MAG: histidine kinase [Acidobacteriaceae bacterium]
MPKTPEEWLEEQNRAEQKKGIFKLFLGYAPGVGKTYTMLSEGLRRRSRGEDVVVGIVETHGRKGTSELAAQFEAVPRKPLEYKGTVFEEMDVDAILARAPHVVLVDELAHTNIEGSRHKKRYEDVLELLEANINVMSTMNIQHLESVTPTVQSVTGVVIGETVPDWVLSRADEIVLSDLTPEALQMRMRRGDIYPEDRVEKALTNYFRRGNLIALRELALQQLTEAVDRSLNDYTQRKQLEDWRVAERVAVCISKNHTSQALIARGARMAKGLHAEFYVVHVSPEEEGEPNRSLLANIRFAENLGAEVVHLKGRDIARTVATFLREQKITQVIFGRSATDTWRQYLYLHAVQKVLRDAPHVDLHIVTQ